MPKIIGESLASHRELTRARLFEALGSLMGEPSVVGHMGACRWRDDRTPGCAAAHALRTPPPQFVTTPSTQRSHSMPNQRRLRGHTA